MIFVSKNKLRIDWATHESAKYACENWHYLKKIGFGKNNKIGVWENNKFIGAIIFGYSATPNVAKKYSLKQNEIVELQRVALRQHKSEVSRMISLAIKFLKKKNPKLKLIISFADCDRNHHGGIYQAGNWIYTGISMKDQKSGYIVRNKYMHCRSAGMKGRNTLEWVRKNLDSNAVEFITKGKHSYLMPLNEEMRQRILPLSKPYLKRTKSGDDGDHPYSDGATPIRTLQAVA